MCPSRYPLLGEFGAAFPEAQYTASGTAITRQIAAKQLGLASPLQTGMTAEEAVNLLAGPSQAEIPGLVQAGGLGGILGFLGTAALGLAAGVLTDDPISSLSSIVGGGGGGVGGVVLASEPELRSRSGIVDGVSVGGPGVPEPAAQLVAKYWKTLHRSNDQGNFWVHHWILKDGRWLTFNPRKDEWQIWRPKKNIVISSNPRLSQLAKLNRVYHRVGKQVMRYGKDFMPKTRKVQITAPMKYLSPAERKSIREGG